MFLRLIITNPSVLAGLILQLVKVGRVATKLVNDVILTENSIMFLAIHLK